MPMDRPVVVSLGNGRFLKLWPFTAADVSTGRWRAMLDCAYACGGVEAAQLLLAISGFPVPRLGISVYH
jgi:hypothetical protein